MNEPEYQKMHDAEDHYWWFVARRDLAKRLLFRYIEGEPGRLLDLGCGTGAALNELQVEHPQTACIGVDAYATALELSYRRGLAKLVLGSGTAIPLQSGAIDCAISLDTIEHIEDDARVLSEMYRALRPHGIAVISVPAYQWLWGPHDVALMHYRRYTARQFKRLAEKAGFRVVLCSYSVFFLFPVVVLIRLNDRLSRRPNRVSLPKVPDWMNRLLLRLMAFESVLLQFVSLPWGSSVVAVIERPN